MNDKLKIEGPSIGLSTLVFIVFLTLKLCKVIDWSWVWVTAPLWAPFTLFFCMFLICCVICGAAALFVKKR